MQRNPLPAAIVAGALLGLGLEGLGMYIMRQYTSPEFVNEPLWHNNLSAATMVLVFAGLVMLATLFVFTPDDGKSRPSILLLRATAVWIIIWAVAGSLL